MNSSFFSSSFPSFFKEEASPDMLMLGLLTVMVFLSNCRLSLALNSLTVAVPPQHAMKVTEVFDGDSVMVYGSDAPLGRGPGQALR